jgi:UDPglucose 6-dehydrogenase
MKYRVGVIGNGFVGEAQVFAFSPVADIRIYDIDPLKATHTLSEVCECDFVFVCVPTPMMSNGDQDRSYINAVFQQVNPGPVYILKSTVLPGTTQSIQQQYDSLDIVFCPEFLTERTAKLDMLTQSRIVIGGSEVLRERVQKLFEIRFGHRNYILTDIITAELVKYMNNTFFATKVSIMNEFKRLADALGASWPEALGGFLADERVANSHVHVPGPDGKLGYGGTCFPKDVNAIIALGERLGTPMHSIAGGWQTNLEVRPEQDWLSLKGRAIS